MRTSEVRWSSALFFSRLCDFEAAAWPKHWENTVKSLGKRKSCEDGELFARRIRFTMYITISLMAYDFSRLRIVNVILRMVWQQRMSKKLLHFHSAMWIMWRQPLSSILPSIFRIEVKRKEFLRQHERTTFSSKRYVIIRKWQSPLNSHELISVWVAMVDFRDTVNDVAASYDLTMPRE